MATQDSPNLYERLGGVYSIATVVDDLIDRVMADERLNAIEGFFAKRSVSSAAFSGPCGNSKMPSTASSTTTMQTQNPLPGPRTQTKSSPPSDEGTKC